MIHNIPEDFTPHVTHVRPVPPEHGAVVLYRNGSKAIVPPVTKYNYAGDSGPWFQLGADEDEDGEDIVAYKIVELTDTDKTIWRIIEYFSLEEEMNRDLSNEHVLSIHALNVRRKRIFKDIIEYAENWPHDASISELPRIWKWFDPNRDE